MECEWLVFLYFTFRAAASTMSVPSNVQHFLFASPKNKKIKKCQNNWKITTSIRGTHPYFVVKCCAAMIIEFEGERSNPINLYFCLRISRLRNFLLLTSPVFLYFWTKAHKCLCDHNRLSHRLCFRVPLSTDQQIRLLRWLYES